VISYNDFLFDHSEKARYSIVHEDPNEYSLLISQVLMSDAGFYICEDVNANPVNKQKHGLQLTVLGKCLFLYKLHFKLHFTCDDFLRIDELKLFSRFLV